MGSPASKWVSGIGAMVLIGIPVLVTADPLSSWDKILPTQDRFQVLISLQGEGVLDKNTGLVWEHAPDATTRTWADATLACINKNVGGQKGFRLPAIVELASLIDPSVNSPGPTLPWSHPFLNIQSAGNWSATTDAGDPTLAWVVFFVDGHVAKGVKAGNLHVWCVRGGMQESVY